MIAEMVRAVPEEELRARVGRWLADVERRELTLARLLNPLPRLGDLRPFGT